MLWSSPVFLPPPHLPPVGSLQKGSWGPDDGAIRRRGGMKEAYGIGSPTLYFSSGRALLHLHQPCFSSSVPQAEGCGTWQIFGLGEWVGALHPSWHIITTIITIARPLSASHSRWELRPPSLGSLGQFLLVRRWQAMALLNGQAPSPVTAPWCVNGGIFSPLFNLEGKRKKRKENMAVCVVRPRAAFFFSPSWRRSTLPWSRRRIYFHRVSSCSTYVCVTPATAETKPLSLRGDFSEKNDAHILFDMLENVLIGFVEERDEKTTNTFISAGRTALYFS